MEIIVWVAIGVVLVAAVLFFVTYRVPVEKSGAIFLRNELARRGVPTDHLSPAFYADCVAFAKKISFFSHRDDITNRAEFVRSLENLASMVELWRREPDSKMFATHGDGPSLYRTLFEKHHV